MASALESSSMSTVANTAGRNKQARREIKNSGRHHVMCQCTRCPRLGAGIGFTALHSYSRIYLGRGQHRIILSDTSATVKLTCILHTSMSS